MLLAQIAELSERIETLDKQIRERAAQDEAATRLMTMPGIGAITATALVPPLRKFSPRGGISPPGSGSRPDSIRPAVESALAGSRAWGKGTFVGS
jgi:hypothetical protein